MKNLKLIYVLFMLLLSPILMSSSCEGEAEVTTTEEVQQVGLNRIIVDVRTPQEFNSGAIDGAVNIPVNELENRLDEVNGYDEIVVYCRSGARSTQAKAILDNAGYKNVINGGGIDQMRQNQK
jgi:rhodanese-related sulfurtransferase